MGTRGKFLIINIFNCSIVTNSIQLPMDFNQLDNYNILLDLGTVRGEEPAESGGRYFC